MRHFQTLLGTALVGVCGSVVGWAGDNPKDLRLYDRGGQEYRLIFRTSDSVDLNPDAYLLNRLEDPQDNPITQNPLGSGVMSPDAWTTSLSKSYASHIELEGYLQTAISRAMLPLAATLKSVVGKAADSNPIGNAGDMRSALLKSVLTVRSGLVEAWKKSQGNLPEDAAPMEKEVLFVPLSRNEKEPIADLFYQSRKFSVSALGWNALRRGNPKAFERVLRFHLRGALQQAVESWDGKAAASFIAARTLVRMSKTQLRSHMQALLVLHPRTVKNLDIKNDAITLQDLVIPSRIQVGDEKEVDAIPVALVDVYQQLDSGDLVSGRMRIPAILEFRFGEFDRYSTATTEFTISAKASDPKAKFTAPMFTIVADGEGESKTTRRKLVPRLQGALNRMWKFGPAISQLVKVDLNLLKGPVNLETTQIPKIDLAVSPGVKIGSHRLTMSAFEIESVDKEFTRGVNDAINAAISQQIKATEARVLEQGEDALGVSDLGGMIPIPSDDLIRLILNGRRHD